MCRAGGGACNLWWSGGAESGVGDWDRRGWIGGGSRGRRRRSAVGASRVSYGNKAEEGKE